MEISVTDFLSGSKKSTKLKVSDAIFAAAYNETLVHQATVAELAGLRQGSASKLTRGEVKCSTRKLGPQKGSGGARPGTGSTPLRRSGGLTFAPKPRDFSVKLNKKMRRVALRAILSERLRRGDLHVVEAADLTTCKTAELAAQLKKAGVAEQKTLLVTDDVSKNWGLASRNLPTFSVQDLGGFTPVNLLSPKQLYLTVGAVRKIEELLA